LRLSKGVRGKGNPVTLTYRRFAAASSSSGEDPSPLAETRQRRDERGRARRAAEHVDETRGATRAGARHDAERIGCDARDADVSRRGENRVTIAKRHTPTII
jgi:hypothetical protein